MKELSAIKARLEANNIPTRGVEDHEGWCSSIYFTDPNGLQLEYCCQTRPLTAADAEPVVRFRVSAKGEKLPLA